MTADEADKIYPLEPEPEPESEPAPKSTSDRDADAAAGADAPDEHPGSVHDLDVCPNCGAPMRGSDELLCLRCGFDLKTMQLIETKKGEVAAAADGDEPEPIVRPGFGDGWLGYTLAGIGVAVLLIGVLAGATGLFMTDGPEGGVIPWSARFLGLAREPVVIVMGVLCGLGGLVAVGWAWSRPVGDFRLAAQRMLGIVAIARLASFFDLKWLAMELMTEIVVQAAVFFAGVLALFRLTAKESATVLMASVTALFTIYVAALLITWAL